MIKNKTYMVAAITALSLLSAAACYITSSVQGCGGGSGYDWLVCEDGSWGSFHYTETIGYVDSCVDSGASAGAGGCKDVTENCIFTKTWDGCPTPTFRSRTNSVAAHTDDGSYCGG
jgi:hypothetical protein